MSRVFDFLDLAPVVPVLDAERHAIGGNPSRFGPSRIKLDEAWRTELSSSQIKKFEQIAGTELDRYMRHGALLDDQR